MGLLGPPNIKEMKAKKNINGLIKALHYKKDDKVRQAALEALVDINDKQAHQALLKALKDEDKNLRIATIRTICDTYKHIRLFLINRLKNDNSDARAHTTLTILDQIKIEPLTGALKDTDEEVRQVAADALEELGYKPEKNLF